MTVIKYTPKDWYWRSDDGLIYCSAKQSLVKESDSGYQAFIEKRPAARWPVDLDGKQTDESLLQVIGVYGLHLTPSDALATYAQEKFVAVRGGGVIVGGVKVETDAHSLAELHLTSAFAKKTTTTAAAVADFLLAARTTYNTVLDGIKAGKIKTKADVDNAAWPNNS